MGLLENVSVKYGRGDTTPVYSVLIKCQCLKYYIAFHLLTYSQMSVFTIINVTLHALSDCLSPRHSVRTDMMLMTCRHSLC